MSEPSEKPDLPAPEAAPPTPEAPQEWLGSAKEKDAARQSASASGSSRRAFLFKLAVGINGSSAWCWPRRFSAIFWVRR